MYEKVDTHVIAHLKKLKRDVFIRSGCFAIMLSTSSNRTRFESHLTRLADTKYDAYCSQITSDLLQSFLVNVWTSQYH